MVFNTTFNNISVISWRSVLLVEETGVPGENHRPVASHWQTLSHNVVSSTPFHEQVLNTDSIGSCKSNYHTIMTWMWHIPGLHNGITWSLYKSNIHFNPNACPDIFPNITCSIQTLKNIGHNIFVYKIHSRTPKSSGVMVVMIVW
jgi:hypothetical protein